MTIAIVTETANKTRKTLSLSRPSGQLAKKTLLAKTAHEAVKTKSSVRFGSHTQRPAKIAKPRTPRQLAREMALQAIYHILMNPAPIESVIAQVVAEHKQILPKPINKTISSVSSHDVLSATTLMSPRPMEFAGALLQPINKSTDAAPENQHDVIYYSKNTKQVSKPMIKPGTNKAINGTVHPDQPFFIILALGCANHFESLKTQLKPCVDRSMSEVSPMVRAILILGAYELIHKMATPVQVVLNEAIELAKRYASDEAYRYVNGVLEKLAYVVRIDEMQKKH